MITSATANPAEEPLTLGHDLGEQLRHAEREYRLELGWPTIVRGDQLLLELDDDTRGILVPRSPAVTLLLRGAVVLAQHPRPPCSAHSAR